MYAHNGKKPKETEFNLGQVVYLVTDPEQSERMVTGIQITLSWAEIYTLSCGESTSTHYAGEISDTKKIV